MTVNDCFLKRCEEALSHSIVPAIALAAHANGVDFLMQDAKDKTNTSIDYGSLVSALKSRGVKFEICEITLKNRNLKKEQFNLDADFTPSGVVRIAQLQSRQQHAYIKP